MVCPYLTQNWVKTTQHFLECNTVSIYRKCIEWVHIKIRANRFQKSHTLFQPKFGSNMDKPKCWVKNVI